MIQELMDTSTNDRVRLAAAQFIIERGYGKAPERSALLDVREQGPMPGYDLTPIEAYMQVIECKTFEEIQAVTLGDEQSAESGPFSQPILAG